MLVSIVLGAVLLQQDANIAKAKWDKVRAVWDGYAGVTGAMGYGESVETFAIVRDGRYLVRTKRADDGWYLGTDGQEVVEFFDGVRLIIYSAATNEYMVEDAPEPPEWSVPFQLLWGTKPSADGYSELSEFLSVREGPGPLDYIGFVTTCSIAGVGSLVLRSRNMTPLFTIERIRGMGNSYAVEFYTVCSPIRYERHCDREVEWSLPPGARLVEQLERDR